MRMRSLLLGVCMVVVPALALFPHQLPPELAAVVRDSVWRPVASWAGWAEPAAPSAEPATATPEDVSAAPVPAVVHGTASPPQQLFAASPATPIAPAAAGRREVEDRLLQLGATSIDCQPLPGGGGTVLASCRMAVDPSGQLQRVFQAAGPEPTATLARLLADVEAWRQRSASRAPAAR